MKRLTLAYLVLSFFCTDAVLASSTQLSYPAARRDATVDDYSGVKVSAPYEWMEDLNSPDVAKWVEAERRSALP